jgi:hypothetical protein
VGTSGVGAKQPFVGIDKGRGPARVVVRSYQCFASRPSELWVVPNWGRLAQKIISPTTGSSARNPSHDEQRALVSRGMRIGEYFRSIWSRIRRCVSRLKLMALALCSWSSFSWIPKRFERGIPSRYKVTVGHDRTRDLTGKKTGKNLIAVLEYQTTSMVCGRSSASQAAYEGSTDAVLGKHEGQKPILSIHRLSRGTGKPSP